MVNRDRIGSYLSTLLVGGALLAGAVMAQGAETKTLEGTISDAMCGIKHKMPNAKQCTLGCVKISKLLVDALNMRSVPSALGLQLVAVAHDLCSKAHSPNIVSLELCVKGRTDLQDTSFP